MKNFLCCVIALCLLAGACKKNNPDADLPPATQEGKNTAGCLINGQAFIAKSYGGGPLSAPIPALQGGVSFDSLYRLSINGQMNGQGVEVMLFLRGNKPATYLLNRNTPYYPQSLAQYVLSHATYRIAEGGNREVYVTNARHTGQVVLTKSDVPRGLSAGTFEFRAVSNQDSTKTVTITSGRFDRKL